jgi:hypothetical protein
LFLAIAIDASELAAVAPNEVAFAMHVALEPLARVLVTVRPDKITLSVKSIVLNRSDIHASVGPLEHADSVLFVTDVDSD